MDHKPTFVALDFETADRFPDSACSIGVVRVENGVIVERVHQLIRPPRAKFEFTHVHGLTWAQCRRASPFVDVWPALQPLLRGVAFIAAHNAGFDKRVLFTCCNAADLLVPEEAFRCTVALARRTWNLPHYNLAAVSRYLNIALRHHHALSDAEACAGIVLAAHAEARRRASAA